MQLCVSSRYKTHTACATDPQLRPGDPPLWPYLLNVVDGNRQAWPYGCHRWGLSGHQRGIQHWRTLQYLSGLFWNGRLSWRHTRSRAIVAEGPDQWRTVRSVYIVRSVNGICDWIDTIVDCFVLIAGKLRARTSTVFVFQRTWMDEQVGVAE